MRRRVSEEIPDVEQIFTRAGTASTYAVLFLAGGLAAFGFAVLGFVVSLISESGILSLQFTCTMPAVAGVGMLTAAWSFAQAPREVDVGPDGVTVWRSRGSRTFAWEEIGWANAAQTAMGYRRRLVLYDTRGKALAKIDESLEGFDRLVKLVQKRVAARGDLTSERIRSTKTRRSALFVAAGSAFMLFISGGLIGTAYVEQQAADALKERGARGEAEIVRRFLAPNGVTPRLEYRVTAPVGRTGTRNAEMVRRAWDALEGQTTVPVLYLPEDPENSRLLRGEAPKDDFMEDPGVRYALAGFMACVCLVGFVAAAFQWNGWSLELDRKTGRPVLKRI